MTFIGFWDDATATAFSDDLDAAMERLRRAGTRPGGYLYLCDFSRSAIQSPAMVERFQRLAAGAGTQARRVATIVASVLQRMQTQRMAASYDHYRFFLVSGATEAEAWLLSQEPIRLERHTALEGTASRGPWQWVMLAEPAGWLPPGIFYRALAWFSEEIGAEAKECGINVPPVR